MGLHELLLPLSKLISYGQLPDFNLIYTSEKHLGVKLFWWQTTYKISCGCINQTYYDLFLFYFIV